MLYEINKLIDFDFSMLKKLGWLLYDREDQNGGLNQEAYNEGFNDIWGATKKDTFNIIV
ncbi:hypothetical protein JK635_02425 [Neobacillus sp. YIM B02564]|uniref:Uncharacterized protein n=1 Tax=Neobacillus paridis TaxID=2803862 RepID=A0ABS1TIE8_9BACI|nr:hypothetical protein [Neobacillus paridis]MBL4951096.1 hypothetical protein [Neobacillus paridis]